MGLRRISAYRRENGRVGVRNHVVILSVDDISNAACEAVASHIKGTMALPHAYGRLQFGEDLELFFRTMIGIGSNPNVAAAVVIESSRDGRTVLSTASRRPASRLRIFPSRARETFAPSRTPATKPRNLCSGRRSCKGRSATSTSCTSA